MCDWLPPGISGQDRLNEKPTSWCFVAFSTCLTVVYRSFMAAKTFINHYTDVTMTMMASQITSLTVVYSTVYLDADHRKHQSSASLAFVWGNSPGPVNSPHKGPVTRKMFPFDDVIMWAGGGKSPFWCQASTKSKPSPELNQRSIIFNCILAKKMLWNFKSNYSVLLGTGSSWKCCLHVGHMRYFMLNFFDVNQWIRLAS